MNRKILLTMITMGIGSIILLMMYILLRLHFFFAGSYHPTELFLAWLFLIAEFFTLAHSLNYVINLLLVIKRTYTNKNKTFPSCNGKNGPHVAVVHCSYKEPLELVESGLICLHNLQYANKEIFLLDDTTYDKSWASEEKAQKYQEAVDAICKKVGAHVFRRKWRGAKAGILNDFLEFMQGAPKEGSILTWNSDEQARQEPKYIAVFDIDMNPFPHFLTEVVPIIEKNPKLAFVQTPQYYSNFEYNSVARAAGLLQNIFYEYICEGKDYHNAMFCCGTNVILRTEALRSVGGFDEASVTEDFATSFKLHLKGWNTAYYNKVLSFGLGPEDLGALFKQQFRWSHGNAINLMTTLKAFFKKPQALSPRIWIEYVLSETYYCVGLTFIIMALIPCFYILFDIPTFLFSTKYYLLLFLPYLMLSFSLYVWTLYLRRMTFQDILMGMYVLAICFPIYIKSTLWGILGKRGKFVVTPKGESCALPLTDLLPQLSLSLLCCCAATWGVLRAIYEPELADCITVNTLWVLFHFLFLSSIITFNNQHTPEHA